MAGLGSVGSRIAEDLVRCGIGSIRLVDPETVEAPNMARSVYQSTDIGICKTVALGNRLQAIDGGLHVDQFTCAIAEVDIHTLLSGADLVVLATDDMADQAVLAHWAYWLGIPQVACAVYRKGAAGEVVIVVPRASTSCWNCAVGGDSRSAELRPETDYGVGGRLVGESALGPSINVIASVASQVAVGLIAGPNSVAGRPLARLLAENRTLGMVSTSESWDFFPTVLGEDPYHFAPESVWPRVERRAECFVCGDHRGRPVSRDEGSRFIEELENMSSSDN